MKTGLILAASGALAGGLYAGGALSPGEVYPRPMADVRAELLAMPLPPMALQSVGSPGAAVTVEQDKDSVRWRISLGGRQQAVMAAYMQPESRGTATRVWVERAEGTGSDDWADRISNSAFLGSFAEKSFTEAVDAQLESRPFDFGKAAQAFGQHAQANPQELEALGEDIRGMFEAVSAQVHAQDSMATVPYSGPPRRQMEAATRPSMQLPPQYVGPGGE